MAVKAKDRKKRQRQQKQAEKRKAKRQAKRRMLARRSPQGMAEQMKEAAKAPVLHCSTSEELWQEGMSQVLFSRCLPDGRVAVSVFLIDTYCLGIKDALAAILLRREYDERFRETIDLANKVDLTPEFARKVVEGAVEYARSLGFQPHPDYHKAAPLFGDVDPSRCAEKFEFGLDGKPCYIPGPDDDLRKLRRILCTLESTCGPGNYKLLLPTAFESAFDRNAHS